MANAPQYDAAPSRPLSRGDIKILSLSALGGALEFYDFIIFVYFATVIGHLFFPADMPEWLRMVQTYGIFAAGYLARPLGGIIMAHQGGIVPLPVGCCLYTKVGSMKIGATNLLLIPSAPRLTSSGDDAPPLKVADKAKPPAAAADSNSNASAASDSVTPSSEPDDVTDEPLPMDQGGKKPVPVAAPVAAPAAAPVAAAASAPAISATT